MNREHASIIDVAVAAGVSPATVSRALRGLPHVSPATRRRVESAALDLNYVASPAGTGLASGRTMTVGVVVPLATRWFFSQVVGAAEGVLREGGYDVLLYNLVGAESKASFFQRMPVRRRVDALLVLSLQLSADEIDALLDLKVPVVTLGHHHPSFSSVRIDDCQGSALAVRHLRHLGHESIVMISALEDEDFGFASSHDRRAGFREAMGRDHVEDMLVAGTWGLDGGTHAMEALLSGPRIPTAVFAEYDEMAFGALRTLRRAGLRVPEDISIVGFDDHEMASVVDLTTVAQPVREQGETAARLLLDQLRGRVAEPVDVVLDTWLMVRGSTAGPRADLPDRTIGGIRAGLR